MNDLLFLALYYYKEFVDYVLNGGRLVRHSDVAIYLGGRRSDDPD